MSAVVPEFNAFGMPFLFQNSAAALRVLDGPLGQQLAEKAAAKGLIVLGYWDNGIRHFSNSVRPLRTPSDFAGLKIRIPPDPVTGDIVEALGGKPYELKFSDVYNALRLGLVDGQENPLVNIQNAKFNEVQKYISLTGHKYEMTPFLMSKRAWDALSPIDREIIKEAAREATIYQRELTRKADADAYRFLIAQGVLINKVDRKPFVDATSKIYDKWYASPIGDYVRAVVLEARSQR
jgi:tripartite ATP-independent transporter DctP family solute receptor